MHETLFSGLKTMGRYLFAKTDFFLQVFALNNVNDCDRYDICERLEKCRKIYANL